MKQALESVGYSCESERNPEVALRKYETGDFDVVITDLKMPGMNGLELLDKINEFNPNAKVIIVTGYGDFESKKVAVEKKAYGFFTKPLDMKSFIQYLEKST
jgi:DNA-binding NtrC family response regulator